MASRLMFVLFLLALPFLMEANVARLALILGRSLDITAFRKLITRTAIHAIDDHLRNSSNGLTVFVPTEDAFKNLPDGYLDSLTENNRTQLLLLHVLPKYYSFSVLLSATNPARTLASKFTLNITSGNNTVEVTTGISTGVVTSTFYEEFPFAIYRIDAVLIPAALAT